MAFLLKRKFNISSDRFKNRLTHIEGTTTIVITELVVSDTGTYRAVHIKDKSRINLKVKGQLNFQFILSVHVCYTMSRS